MPEVPESRLTLRHWVPGLLVAAVGIAASLGMYWQQQHAIREVVDQRFERKSAAFTQAVQRRMRSYLEALRGVQGAMMIHPHLTRSDFEQLVENLDLPVHVPGARSVSFTRHVPAEQFERFLGSTRSQSSIGGQSRKNFAVHPADVRSEYFVIEYFWPRTGNESIEGLELQSQPGRLNGTLRARDTHSAAMSAPLALVQVKDDRTGVVMSLPVYDNTGTPGKEAPFLGTVNISVNMKEMIQAVRAEGRWDQIALNISDVGHMDLSNAIVSDRVDVPVYAEKVEVPDFGHKTPHRFERSFRLGGRVWRMELTPRSSMLTNVEARLPELVGAGGLLFTALLAALVSLMTLRRAQDLDHVRAATAARKQSDDLFRTLFGQAAVGVLLIESATGRIEGANQKMSDMLGYTVAEMVGMTFLDFTHPDDRELGSEEARQLASGQLRDMRLEKRYVCKDGRTIWVDLTATVVPDRFQKAIHHVAVVLDITERKQMEDDLRKSEQRVRGILNHLPIGIALVRNDRIDFSNQRFAQISGTHAQHNESIDGWWGALVHDAKARELYRTRWNEAYMEARERLKEVRCGAPHAAMDGASEGDVNGYINVQEIQIAQQGGQTRSLEMAGVALGDNYLITLLDVSQRKAVEERARYLAYYDPLTQLPNRRLLLDRLQQALAMSARQHNYGAVLMLDLDNFKNVNETLGHDTGDRLLGIVAQRLRSCTHADDTVARHGGDEFVVVLRSLGDTEQAAAAAAKDVAKKILNIMREPIQLVGEPIHTTLSIGITLFHGQRESVDELLKRGDLAMYRAKEEGRNSLRFFDPQMQAVVEERVALEADMRVGLDQGQFELVYQPQVSRGHIIGAEVLMRWQHPEKGAISPLQFIPLAEESSLILRMGEWVLQTACERLAMWAEHPVLGDLILSVNVSARQFHQAGFVPQVLEALASTGANARQLRLELTESLLLLDIDDTVKKMTLLKSYGVGFSLDDFGTGYSSLSYLKRLPLDELKIDQSFVRDVLTDPNDAAIAKTIVALGTSLGLQVMAEGVETEAQRQFLERNQCYAWQGYLLSPPLFAKEYEALVLRRADAQALT